MQFSILSNIHGNSAKYISLGREYFLPGRVDEDEEEEEGAEKDRRISRDVDRR